MAPAAEEEASDSDDGMPGMLSDYSVSSDDDAPDDDVEPTQGGARRAPRRMPSSVYEAVRHAADFERRLRRRSTQYR